MPYQEFPYKFSGDGINPVVSTGVGFFYFLVGTRTIILNFTAGYLQEVRLRSMFVEDANGKFEYFEYPTLDFANQCYSSMKNEAV